MSGQWLVVSGQESGAGGLAPASSPGTHAARTRRLNETAHCPLPTAHYPLPTTHYPLPTAHCPLPTTHCPLPTTHCPLPPPRR